MAKSLVTQEPRVFEDGEVQEYIDADTGALVVVSKTVDVSQQKAIGAVSVNGKSFAVKKLVNVPTLKHDDGETVVFRIDAPIFITMGKQKQTVVIGGVKQEVEVENEINVVRVTELYSQQPFEYVCNAMTADNLRTAYPEHSYVGLFFAVQKLGLVPGKRYKLTNIVEIEPAD